MTKAVLILNDVPKNCYECIVRMHELDCYDHDVLVCGKNGSPVQTVGVFKRPGWCPLIPEPEHRAPGVSGQISIPYRDGYNNGWNACLDVIEGKDNGENQS